MTKRKQQRKAAEQRNWLVMGIATLVILGIAIGAVLLSQPTSAGSYPAEISVAEAVAMRDQGAFVLDVRTPEEWADHHPRFRT